jgi:hypothetical protein
MKNLDFKDIKKRILAAEKLLNESSTTRQKFESIRKLIRGLDKNLDEHLEAASKVFSKLGKVYQKKIIDLGLEHLPDKTEKDKKRKKYLLLFLKYWKQLKAEVKRVKKELAKQSAHKKNFKTQTSSFAKITATAKGPLGLVTAAATLIAGGWLYLEKQSAQVKIVNQGCDSIDPSAYSQISLPGLKIPQQAIANGQTGQATLPPLKMTLDNSQAGLLKVKSLGINLSFNFDDAGVILLYDGQLLNGQVTTVELGEKKNHQLLVKCE